jgi:hypothetical protein
MFLKCDQGQPSCSRCNRLQIPCIGSGERRFKFQEQLPFRSGSSSAFARTSHRNTSAKRTPRAVPSPPRNEVALLIDAFTQMIKPSTDLRFNLAWSAGLYLELVPQRLGTNAALDASAACLIDAHSNFCLHRDVSVDSLVKYSRALNQLKEHLSDPVKARTSETLCAVMLLLACQVVLPYFSS